MESAAAGRRPVFASRRRFLGTGTLALLVVAGSTPNWSSAQSNVRVEEGEAEAIRLGYKHDGAQVNRQAYPKYRAEQSCASCQFYKGKAGEPAGPCQVFKGRSVSAKGWCISYWRVS